MQQFRNLSIRAKLLITLLGISLLSVGVIGWTGYNSAQQSLKAEAFDKLESVRANKTYEVEQYFSRIRSQIRMTSAEDQTARAMQEFHAAFQRLERRQVAPSENGSAALQSYYQQEFVPRLKEGVEEAGSPTSYLPEASHVRYLQDQYIASNPNPVGQKDKLVRPDEGRRSYHDVHAEYHDLFRRLLKEFNYYDVFLVEPESGHIVYSVYKEVDFGTSLTDGPYQGSNFARAYRQVKNATSEESTQLVDFERYAPSYGAPASFMASPVMDEGEVVGVLVFQVPVGGINRALTGNQEWHGLGETGESFLVGADGRMRSDSRFLLEHKDAYLQALRKQGYEKERLRSIENHGTSILYQEVHTDAAEKALAGESGHMMERDYRGEPVLSAYSPVDIAGVEWGLVSKIDQKEALSAVNALTWQIGGWGAVLLFLAGGIALGFVRMFTGPIMALRDASEEVAAGNLSVSVPVQSDDEVGQLTSVFNEMVDQNREALAEAEDRQEEARRAREKAEEAKDRAEQQREQLRTNVETMLGAMDRFADGDLTVRLDSASSGGMDRSDQIQRLFEGFNQAVESVQKTLADVKGAAERTASAAGQINTSSEQVAASAEEQSTQAEEVAAAVEELNQTINENARSVQKTAEAAETGAQQARSGQETVGQATDKIEEIAEQAHATADAIEQLGASSKEIGKVVDRIDEIAEQTNLLALNAAIEAARAGDETGGQTGQGFAVVAEEVRELAEEADQATDEIAEMIEQVQSETGEAVEAARQSSRMAEEGIELAGRAREALDEIVTSIATVEERVDEIAAASEEQSTTSEQIAQSVQSISTAAQESAAGVTQVSDAAGDLEGVTGRLQEGVRQFRVEEDASEAERSEGAGAAEPAEVSPTVAEPTVGGNGHRGDRRS